MTQKNYLFFNAESVLFEVAINLTKRRTDYRSKLYLKKFNQLN
jgi:hypothetical protein